MHDFHYIHPGRDGTGGHFYENINRIKKGHFGLTIDIRLLLMFKVLICTFLVYFHNKKLCSLFRIFMEKYRLCPAK